MGSVDVTSASIQALRNFENVSGLGESISKAELFLKEKQKENGSFEDNIFSTSWAIGALIQNNSFDFEVNKAIEYIKNTQQDDGGITENSDINNRIWATAYAIPSILKLSWNDILESFPREEIKSDILKIENKIEISEKNEIQNKKIQTKIIKKENSIKNTEQINNNILSATVINYDQENTKKNSSTLNKIFKK
jgi:prenyltransferase beta subunit